MAVPGNQQRAPTQQRQPNDQEVIVIPLHGLLGPLQTIVCDKSSWDSVSEKILQDGVDPEETYILVGPHMPNGRVERSFLRGVVGFYTSYPTGVKLALA